MSHDELECQSLLFLFHWAQSLIELIYVLWTATAYGKKCKYNSLHCLLKRLLLPWKLSVPLSWAVEERKTQHGAGDLEKQKEIYMVVSRHFKQRGTTKQRNNSLSKLKVFFYYYYVDGTWERSLQYSGADITLTLLA